MVLFNCTRIYYSNLIELFISPIVCVGECKTIFAYGWQQRSILFYSIPFHLIKPLDRVFRPITFLFFLPLSKHIVWALLQWIHQINPKDYRHIPSGEWACWSTSLPWKDGEIHQKVGSYFSLECVWTEWKNFFWEKKKLSMTVYFIINYECIYKEVQYIVPLGQLKTRFTEDH